MTTSIGLVGLKAHRINVSAKILPGPRNNLVCMGLKESQARELRIRVLCALESCDIPFNGRAEVTFDWPDLATPATDFAVFVAVLEALGRPPTDEVLLGELSLAGDLRNVRGLLPMLRGSDGPAIVPYEGRAEASLCRPRPRAVKSLRDFLVGAIHQVEPWHIEYPRSDGRFSMTDVELSDAARAFTSAVAGQKSILLLGPPGTGKTMLARRAASLLPPMSEDEALESASITSVAGLGASYGTRPFRAPHHTVSSAGLVGGARPGEVSLAHNGVLFLDEITEFRLNALETLQMVLNAGRLDVIQGANRFYYPAAPAAIVASANMCGCGYAPGARCKCTSERIDAHMARLEKMTAGFNFVRIEI